MINRRSFIARALALCAVPFLPKLGAAARLPQRFYTIRSLSGKVLSRAIIEVLPGGTPGRLLWSEGGRWVRDEEGLIYNDLWQGSGD